MIYDNSETTGLGRPQRPRGRPAHRRHPSTPRPPQWPEPNIDLDRLVWDPEYREQVRQHLKRLGQGVVR